jgi:hypothetical protein
MMPLDTQLGEKFWKKNNQFVSLFSEIEMMLQGKTLAEENGKRNRVFHNREE